VTAPGPGNAGNNILSVAADYSHDFGGWNLTAGGGGEWAFAQYTAAGATAPNDQRPAWYQGGLQVGFGHLEVGVSGAYYANYAQTGYPATTASPSDDGWVLSGGASYTIDAWSSVSRASMAATPRAPRRSWAPRCRAPRRIASSCGVSPSTAPMLWEPGISLEAQIACTHADYGHVFASGVAVPTPIAVGVNADQVTSWEIDAGTAINF
jgi:hypothetical protein